ncbi:MAG: GNAT family N-acetyltransferase [Nocardioidaceae bacterium]
MSDLTWTHEETPMWDEDKRRVIGGAPSGAFVLPFKDGQVLPGDWFSARDADGTVVGYGRLDTTWGGDAEILLAVDPDRQQQGVGSFVLGHLEDEAAARGINYVHNTIREHDNRDLVHDWLVVRGFTGSSHSELRKRVRSTPAEPQRRTPRPAEEYDVTADPGGRPPGHEESGGYVNLDEHRY